MTMYDYMCMLVLSLPPSLSPSPSHFPSLILCLFIIQLFMLLVIFNFILHVNLHTTLWTFGLCLLDISVLACAHTNRTPYEFLWSLFPSRMCKKQPILSSIFSHKRQEKKSSHQKSFLSPTATLIMLSASAEGMR